MDVSVLIPTYNGSRSVHELLSSLVAAEVPHGLTFEVVVVDNNSSDDTKAAVLSFLDRLPTLKYTFEPEPGKSRAVNAGLRLCQGTVVAFLDHDVIVQRDYFVALKLALESQDYKVFGGRVIAKWTREPPYWVNRGEPLLQSRGGIIAHDYGEHAREYTPDMRLPVGCNFFCRKSLLDRFGNFNVHLGPRPGAQIAGEEMDLLMRFQRGGEKILYLPAATVVHPVVDDRITKRWFRHRLFCDGRCVVRINADRPPLPSIFGISRYVYRQCAEEAGRMLLCLLKGESFERFDHELNLWYCAGIIYESRRIKKRGLVD